jgi:hypothetical protein
MQKLIAVKTYISYQTQANVDDTGRLNRRRRREGIRLYVLHLAGILVSKLGEPSAEVTDERAQSKNK